MVSPVTGSGAVRLVKEIQTSYIVKLYRDELGMDVSRFFTGISAVQLYECSDTGYRFYFPMSVAGDAELYEKLQEIQWYYASGKEEHAIAAEFVSAGDDVLEVGCGSGIFLDLLQTKDARGVGLEFNSKAVEKASAKGHKIFQEPVEAHAAKNLEKYDVVASFQVLEHVVDVKGFLEGSLKALKTGGRLIVSVPNNDGAYHKNHDDPLNMPPHHMGLWGINTLISLQTHFPLRLEKLFTDTSTPVSWIHHLAMKSVEEAVRTSYGFLSPFICKVGGRFIRRGAESMAEHLPGQTVTAFFRKMERDA